MSRRRTAWAIILGAVIGCLACLALIHADLALSALYYRAGSGFYLDSAWWVQLVYRGLPWLVGLYSVLLVLALVRACLSSEPRWRNHRGALWFLLLTLIIGPGLITHTLLKNHWGRPRPVQIQLFGGHEHYVPPLIPSRQDGHSFPSGHAAAAFYLIGFGWAFPRRRRVWWIVGLLAGIGVGYVRIVQGGHFLSDVMFAFIVVWLTNILLARWMRSRGWLPAVRATAPV